MIFLTKQAPPPARQSSLAMFVVCSQQVLGYALRGAVQYHSLQHQHQRLCLRLHWRPAQLLFCGYDFGAAGRYHVSSTWIDSSYHLLSSSVVQWELSALLQVFLGAASANPCSNISAVVTGALHCCSRLTGVLELSLCCGTMPLGPRMTTWFCRQMQFSVCDCMHRGGTQQRSLSVLFGTLCCPLLSAPVVAPNSAVCLGRVASRP